MRTAATELGLGLAELRDLLLPGRCAVCDAPASGGVCAPCLTRCRLPAGPACPRCGAPWRRGLRGRRPGCGRCRRFGRPFAFETAAGLWAYRGPVRTLVHAFKYRGRVDVIAPLGRRMAASPRLAGPALGARRPLVVPVPARRLSRRRRGYDQAVLLAQALAAALGLPARPAALGRRRETPEPQAGRSPTQRRRQVRAAFRARPDLVTGRDVLLVDDVISTGATADAATRALIAGGAARVSLLALAT